MEQVWNDAFEIIFGEQQDPKVVIKAITAGLTELEHEAMRHPAMQALTAYLAFLFGSPYGPDSDLLVQVGLNGTKHVPDVAGK